MKSQLRDLEGLTVTEVIEIHDYIQLAFGTDVGMSIYNDWFIIPETVKFQQLVGKKVTSVVENKDFIVLKFLDGTKLNIDIRPQAYHCPEALQLDRRGKPTVVVN